MIRISHKYFSQKSIAIQSFAKLQKMEVFSTPNQEIISPNIIAEFQEEDRINDAVYRFNIDPKKGIRCLCEVMNTSESPNNIAHLLHTVEGLIGEKIGDFLSYEGNEEIAISYFDEMPFEDNIVDALRTGLSGSMRFPQDSELIDKIILSFARSFFGRFPDSFPSHDVVYVISFAIVLLNSDLHNPQIKYHMTQSQFIENIRGVASESDISDQELIKIYNDIKKCPLTFKKYQKPKKLNKPRSHKPTRFPTPEKTINRHRSESASNLSSLSASEKLDKIEKVSHIRSNSTTKITQPSNKLCKSQKNISASKSQNNERSSVVMAYSNPIAKGFLLKKSQKWHFKWTKRFFVLVNGCLYYFKDISDNHKEKPLGMIQLVDVISFINDGRPTEITIKSINHSNLQAVKFEKHPTIVTNMRSFVLQADSKEEAIRWLYRIKEATVSPNNNSSRSFEGNLVLNQSEYEQEERPLSC
ncbi:hypothetical protein TRFO_41223 [Tritrichomonas foetus]|uniref:Uncharacterized protein n=1 Tax=Tritrichomonas foetus TaxID=1144522 RepID=A0A1J4L282_9EUKA|nr:hypothetical protein TRFO_41223 [Tritrichomonas foetus]|eukprot:OHT17192.1 hypothetical protein TRFO_41223 [Tritrichomonas foetus]